MLTPHDDSCRFARTLNVGSATGTDAVLNVGIIGDRIAAVGPASTVNPADATTVRDCAGLIVAPGFIDLHAHGQNNESARLQACDGVTTHVRLVSNVHERITRARTCMIVCRRHTAGARGGHMAG